MLKCFKIEYVVTEKGEEPIKVMLTGIMGGMGMWVFTFVLGARAWFLNSLKSLFHVLEYASRGNTPFRFPCGNGF